MIRKSLQVSRHGKHMQTLPDTSRFFLHEGKQLEIAGGTQGVNSIVGDQYAAGQICVAGHKCVQTFLDHRLDKSRHERNIDGWLDPRRLDQRCCSVGDIDRYISHTFQVGVDFQSCDDEAEVDRHRLVERQQVNCKTVDLQFDHVDL